MALELKAVIRTESGKGPARRLRAAGKIPAAIYGGDGGTQSLTVEERAMSAAIQSGERLLNVLYDHDGTAVNRQSLIKEVQQDAISLAILHVDFYEVSADTEVSISVPVRTTGTPVGEATGGKLAQEMHEIEVSCLPQNIPDEIVVDVAGLEVGQGVHVGELELPPGVTAVTNEQLMVAQVVLPRGLDVEETPEEAEIEGSVTDVEVIGGEKDEEEKDGE